jgi:ABC-2 type transport system ATP-binding protein
VGIDPQSRRAILDSVKELNRQGMTVLYTTHYMEEAEELSHRVGIIDHGELMAIGTQAELTRQIGEHDTLILLLDDGQDGLRLAAAAREFPAVIKAELNGQALEIITPEAEKVLAPAILKANELGIKIRSVDIREPNLEMVFLQLTGRALRD